MKPAHVFLALMKELQDLEGAAVEAAVVDAGAGAGVAGGRVAGDGGLHCLKGDDEQVLGNPLHLL